ncbi:sugar O-acetyltransferase [Pilimelia columellifera]|uniref:Sugar O-acetyltransferase n=1 Tax=Pilimelia columellifera subsp. columellifera TaxID=706583 RepID=A0ABP6AFQ2_9ACTN
MADAGGATMRQRMLAGLPYLADDPELVEATLRAADLADAYNGVGARDPLQRRQLLTRLLGAVGDGTVIRPPLRLDYGTQLALGARCFVNFGLVALDCAPITIGDDVQIGPNVQLLTAEHPVAPAARRDRWESARPITIGDNVWLGAGVIVLAGVSIGRDTVVGAGAVVTRDLPDSVVAVGNPARVIRRADEPGPHDPVAAGPLQ